MLLRKTRAEGVARLWPSLVHRYPDAHSIVRTPKKRLARQLKILGFGNQKADALRLASKWLIKHYDGKVPDSFE
jgi:endonuclease III